MRKWGIIIAAVALVAVLGVVAFINIREARAEAGRCEVVQKLDAATAEPIGSGDPVTVVGDSYSQGFGLDDPRQSWVASLGRTVTVDARSGAGFTKGGLCDGPSLVDLAEGDAGTVIIQGGLNDVGADGLAPKVQEALAAVDGDAVLVGPPLAPNLDAEKIRAVDTTLAEVAAGAGVKYISAVGWELTYSDGLHLTPASHQDFGRKVAAAL